MDPAWTECVYCQQGSAAAASPRPPVPPAASGRRMATIFEGAPAQGYPAQDTGRARTQLEGAPPAAPVPQVYSAPVPPRPAAGGPRSATVILPQGSTGNQPGAQPATVRERRIVGVLVTYSWVREGRVYPVREGRNFIGRDPECEICVAEDTALSGRNSYITSRQGFVVGDMMVNMNGTDLNGEPVDGHEPLPNYATIRAGATHFTFVAIDH